MRKQTFLASLAWAGIVTLGMFAIYPLMALAQATGTVPAADPVTDFIGLLGEMMGALGQWKVLGWVGGVAALLRVLLKLTKAPFFDKIIGNKPWIKPAIATALGVLLAVFSAMASGQPATSALLAGVLAGLSGTGLHELLNMFSAATKAERAAGATLATILTSKDADAVAKYEAAKASLDAIMILPEEARIKALADWANTHPVG